MNARVNMVEKTVGTINETEFSVYHVQVSPIAPFIRLLIWDFTLSKEKPW